MSKTKATKPSADKKASKKVDTPKVKEGRVTKPSQTPKAKSKEIAKSAVVADKKKKSKKAPTPEPESSASEEDSDSESESSESEEETTTKANGKAKPAVAAKAAASSSDSSDSESDSDEEMADAPAATPAKAVAEKEDSDSSDSDSDSESESEAEAKPAAKAAKADDSSDDSSDSDAESDSADSSDSDEKEAPSKKRKAETESAPVVKKNKTEASGEEGIKNLFVGNLSWNVDEDWLSQTFAPHGTIEGCRIITDRESGRSKGFGYVEFSNADEAKAAKEALHGSDLDGRDLNVDFSQPRQQTQDKGAARAKQFGDKRSAPSNTLFIGNLSFDSTNDTIGEAFSSFGEITRVSLPTDRDTGAPKGFGYVEFSSVQEAQAALDGLSGQDVDGRNIRIDFAAARDNSGGDRGGRGGGFGGGRGGGRGGRGGFGDRGGRGGRGRGRGDSRGGRGGFSTNRGGFGDFKGQKMTF